MAGGEGLAFQQALLRARQAGRCAVIAEVKAKASDGTDLLRGRAAAEVAAAYVRGGADCISVVTGKWFGGRPELLSEVSAAVKLPVLCKDFIRSPKDVAQARERGASAVLVTVAVLPEIALRAVIDAARGLDLVPFVEAAKPEEVERARALGAEVIAVNNKDIRARELTGEGIGRSLSLRADGTPEVLWVSASGIESPSEGAALAEAGYDGLLVGTQLLLAEDPERATAELVQAARRGAR